MWFSAVPKPVIDHRCHCGAGGVFGYLVDGCWQCFCAAHRLRQWSADACTVEGFMPEGADDGPPDLQTFVAALGIYDKITAEAWARYDKAMKTWQMQRREKYRRR